LRPKAAGNERIVQQALLLKAIHLQREFDAAQQRWHALFVDSLTTALQAVLGDPLPPQFFAQVRRSAAQFVGDRQQAVLHVAAADEPAVRDALGESRQGQGMAWQVNPTLAAGQCFLDTPFGRVQASLATQLERLRDALSAWWAEQPPITTTAPWATTPPP
jgi:flagellar biosynthesis/type III secretory pathway protein FliH